METKATTLERPRAVQMAAAVLMLTPVLDLMMSQRTGAQVFNGLSWVLIFAAGASLMIRHKLAWMVGIVLCFVIIASTGYSLMKEMNYADPVISTARLLDCLLILFIVGTVTFFFRYPYLDRRQNWFAPTGNRYAISTAVLLGGVETKTLDLSYTGARIALPPQSSYKAGDTVTVQLSEINDIQCKARVIDVKEDHVRVRFDGVSTTDKDLIRQWLSTQNLQKV